MTKTSDYQWRLPRCLNLLLPLIAVLIAPVSVLANTTSVGKRSRSRRRHM